MNQQPAASYFVYCRLSAEEAVRGGMSLEMQEARCREYATSQGLHVAEVFTDYGLSGRSTNRPGFQALCERLAESQGIITWKLDRLSRRVRDIYAFLEQCRCEGKDFVSVAERFDTTSAVGRGFLGMAAVFAELEAEQVAERVKEGNRHRASKGIWLYRAPFGYEYSRQAKLLSPGKRAADCVQVFREYVATNGNLSATARHLNARGIRSPEGRGWTAQGVKGVVANPVYRGRIRYTDVEGDGEWELIVPEGILMEAERLLAANRRLPRGRTKQGRHPFSGLLSCRQCGAPIIVQLRKPNGTVVMRCRSARHGMGCSQPGMVGHRVEDLWLFGLDRAWEEESVELGEEDVERLAASQGWVSREERERASAALEAKKKRIVELCIDGFIERKEMEGRLIPIESELTSLQEGAGEGEAPVSAVRDLLREGVVPGEAWPSMTLAERRRLAMTLLRGPLEVGAAEDRRLRIYADTWLFAQKWEAWETGRNQADGDGRLAYAVRAPD